ncbi:MAG: DUF255 domain-containing protein [Lewinellaceae bacterium]|nr:DUF255 domain-containing protein [Lewinellaceae bacterium]
MRRLLITCLIAFIAGALAAQPTPRANNKTAVKTTLVPAASGQRGNNTAAKQSGSARTAKPANPSPAPSLRSDASNPGTGSNPASESRSNNTHAAGANSRSTTARPSLTIPAAPSTGSTTTKSISNPVKKTAPLKEVNPVKVKWMTLEDALEKSKTEKRKIFVDVMTDWCGWCKRMDSTTFVNPAVAEYLNDHYYPVKFNAEQQEDITFKDKTYRFKKNGARGFHELAAEWLNNRLSYPTVVFLDENQGVIQPLPGYQDAVKMEAILNYFGTDSHKKTPWESYEKNFNQQK